MKEVNIELKEYWHDCGDGCCTTYGTIVKVNGVELDCQNEDVDTILQSVFEHLGYKVNIKRTNE